MNKISIIGYMGSGKSIISSHLAIALGYKKISIDEEIERICNRKINEIFDHLGDFYFRNLERKVIRNSIESLDDVIFDLGGGAPCFFDTMKFLNEHTITVYLHTPIEQLVERLKKEKQNRPLIKHLNDNELVTFIQNHLSERKSFYQKAQHVIDTSNFSIEEIVANIVSEIQY